jgi:hypothetical protein
MEGLSLEISALTGVGVLSTHFHQQVENDASARLESAIGMRIERTALQKKGNRCAKPSCFMGGFSERCLRHNTPQCSKNVRTYGTFVNTLSAVKVSIRRIQREV